MFQLAQSTDRGIQVAVETDHLSGRTAVGEDFRDFVQPVLGVLVQDETVSVVQEPLCHRHQETVPVAGGFLSSLLGFAAAGKTPFDCDDRLRGAADGLWMRRVVRQHRGLKSLGLVVGRAGSLHCERRCQFDPFGSSGTRVGDGSSLMDLSALTQVLPELDTLESSCLLLLGRKPAEGSGVLFGVQKRAEDLVIDRHAFDARVLGLLMEPTKVTDDCHGIYLPDSSSSLDQRLCWGRGLPDATCHEKQSACSEVIHRM
ncbi:hypothetical protein [Streptomyces sp. NPDC059787]|uniref:hypothetical protein n=1 Tax=Streptomyces sp. NPDC059787 TaxID=3346947 RepID=UPI003668398F